MGAVWGTRIDGLAPRLTETTRAGVTMEVDEGARRAGVLVAFAGRHGGVSEPPFDSLNLALTVGDHSTAVHENRRRAAAAAGFEPWSLALTVQVHGADVVRVHRGRAGLMGTADGLVTQSRRPVLGLLTADCAPVVMLGRRLAVAHAGWRGLVGGGAGAPPGGGRGGGGGGAPSIRSCCYEVGPEVIDAFTAAGLPVADAGHVDIPEAAAAALRACGARDVAVSEVCTGCDPRWFSHRRDGTTGRNGAFAALRRH
jgi:copper oxidase (laccase) domain-containing protein